MDLEKLNRRPWGKGRGGNSYKVRGTEPSHKRLLNTENKLRDDGGGVEERGKQGMGIEEGTCWDEPWVLHVSDESWESTPEDRKSVV